MSAPESGSAESDWHRFWEATGAYRYDPARPQEDTFVVDTPPPTVSGSLHIGHVFSYTHTDVAVRFQRMLGRNILYPMGWDDNGLPTERRVQNVFNVRCDTALPYDPDLRVEPGRRGEPMVVSRPNFIELCARLLVDDERQFKQLWQRLGLSVDWDRTYATIDDRSRRVSQLSFLSLVQRGHAELRTAPTMWDVDFRTAVAQAEVEDREEDGTLWRLVFRSEAGERLVVATTRPELVGACVALVAHPEDARYRHLFGGTALTPLFSARVPVMADETAVPDKGTGLVMVCTFGDIADVETWRRHRLPLRELLGRDGRLRPVDWGGEGWPSESAAEAQRHQDRLTGRTTKAARREVVEVLAQEGLLEGEPETTRRAVKFYEKGDSPLEFVVSRQWFVKVLGLKDELIAQGRRIRWHPASFLKRYENWVAGLNQDWCVSRQRPFGVAVPVWYRVGDDGRVDHSRLLLPAPERLPVDPSSDAPEGFAEDQRGRPGGFVGDGDVFDTWATSSLTPYLIAGWPDDPAWPTRYPADLRPQSHDIIRTWAFYSILRSYLEDGSVPWSDIAISGFVVDPDRKKMSKSKGNVVLPVEMLDAYGSDAVRYWACSTRLGLDGISDANVFKQGRRLTIKLRNAANLVLRFQPEGEGAADAPLDRALLGRLRGLVAETTRAYREYEHARALDLVERWFWTDFCDYYLELAKDRAYGGDPSAVATARQALDVVLRLFAPTLPFVTEEIWQSAGAAVLPSLAGAPAGSRAPIHVAAWPSVDELPEVPADRAFDLAMMVLAEVRRAKSQASRSVRFPVARLTVRGTGDDLDALRPVLPDVLGAANALEWDLREEPSLEELQVETELAADTSAAAPSPAAR